MLQKYLRYYTALNEVGRGFMYKNKRFNNISCDFKQNIIWPNERYEFIKFKNEIMFKLNEMECLSSL